MKKIILVFTLLMILSSCNKTDDVPELKSYDKYKMSDLPESAFYLGEDTTAFFPYGDKIYTVGSEVGVYDVFADMEYSKLCDISDSEACNIYVTDDGICLLSGFTVSQLGFDGTTAAEYNLPEHEGRRYNSFVCVTEKYIMAACDYYDSEAGYNSYIYSIDIENGSVVENNVTESTMRDSYLMFEPGENPNEAVIVKINNIHSYDNIRVYGAYIFNADSGKLTLVTDYDYTLYGVDYIAEANMQYAVMYDSTIKSEGVINISRGEVGVSEFIGSLSYGVDSAFDNVKIAVEKAGKQLKYMNYNQNNCFFATGYDFIMWDKKNKTAFVFGYDENISGESLTILYPKTYYTKAEEGDRFYVSSMENSGLEGAIILPNRQFEAENDVKITTKYFELNEFNERLRMKLLAGERDYDIVYLDNADKLLPYILKYSLYLPLEDYAEINSGFDNYVDGVKDVMSYDGHIYGVPYSISGYALALSGKFYSGGLSVPSTDFTLEDFWNLCEVAEQNLGGKTFTIDFRLFIESMQNIIEDGALKGEIDRSAIRNFIDNFIKYSDAGVLGGWQKETMPLANTQPFVNPKRSTSYDESYRELRGYPSPDGRQYYTIKSMIYANSLTENPENAVKYLSLLMSEDYGPETAIGKSYLWKDSSAYFQYEFNGFDFFADDYTLPDDGAYEWLKLPVGCSATARFMLENIPSATSNAAPRLYSGMMEEIIDEVYDALDEGSMTADEAAEKIYSEANYRILE